jgi:hypothetical protein
MAEIIQFPLNIERRWARIEKIIEERMEEAGTPDEARERVLAWHKEIWFKYKKKSHFSLELKLDCKAPHTADISCREAVAEAFYDVQDHFHHFSSEMLGEMLRLKVELETYTAMTKKTSVSPTHRLRS